MGFGATLLMNPIVMVILAVLLIVGVVTGALFLIFAPEIMAAVLIAVVALWLLIKGPFADPRLRVGIPLILIAIAILIFFFGEGIVGAII